MITSALGAIHRIGNSVTENAARGEKTSGPGPAAGISSFADALGEMAQGAIGNLQHAESMSIQGIQGKADTREVVDAVMSAEQSLQAAISIRDKIVSSYLEISRMQI